MQRGTAELYEFPVGMRDKEGAVQRGFLKGTAVLREQRERERDSHSLLLTHGGSLLLCCRLTG